MRMRICRLGHDSTERYFATLSMTESFFVILMATPEESAQYFVTLNCLGFPSQKQVVRFTTLALTFVFATSGLRYRFALRQSARFRVFVVNEFSKELFISFDTFDNHRLGLDPTIQDTNARRIYIKSTKNNIDIAI